MSETTTPVCLNGSLTLNQEQATWSNYYSSMYQLEFKNDTCPLF